MKKKIFIGVLILIGAIFLFYQFGISKAQDSQVKSYTVKKQTLKDTLSFSGKIEADEKVTLKFQTSGRLAWVGVKQGDYVKKFQGIASLDQRELQQNLKKYLNTYASERFDFDQTKDDYKDRAVTLSVKKILEQAQFDLNNSVIDVELKNLALEYSYLFTPIEGVVVRVETPNPGVNITAAQAEFEVINPKSFYFSALADQTEVIKLNESQAGEIIFDAFPEKTINGKIETISFIPKSGETGTVYEVKIKFTEVNDAYRLGMTGDVTFNLKEASNVISVPENYVKSENGKKYIFVDENGNRIKKFIKTGVTMDGDIEIKEGLKEGDIVYD